MHPGVVVFGGKINKIFSPKYDHAGMPLYKTAIGFSHKITPKWVISGRKSKIFLSEFSQR
jgi:hypothetical protein